MSSTLAHPHLPPPIPGATFGAPTPTPIPPVPSSDNNNAQVDDKDKDEREGGSFLDHLACDVCHAYFNDRPDGKYWMTSCGHILCESPEHQNKPKTCTACNKTIESFPLTQGMPPHFSRWFKDTRNPVKDQFAVLARAREIIGELAATESLLRVLQFQVVHLKGQNKHLREFKNKDHDAYAALKEENAALKEENGALKNENSTMKTSYKNLELKRSTLESKCSALEIENSTLTMTIDDLRNPLANSIDAAYNAEEPQYPHEGQASDPFITQPMHTPNRAIPYQNQLQYPMQYGGSSRADADDSGSGKRRRMTINDQRQQRYVAPQTPSQPQSQFMTPRPTQRGSTAVPHTPNRAATPVVGLGLSQLGQNRPSSLSPKTGSFLEKFRYQGNAPGHSTPERPLEPQPRTMPITQPGYDLDAPQTSLTGDYGYRLDQHMNIGGAGAARGVSSREMPPPPVPVRAQAQAQAHDPYSQHTHAIPQTPQHRDRTNQLPRTPQVSQDHERDRDPMGTSAKLALPTSVNRSQVRQDRF